MTHLNFFVFFSLCFSDSLCFTGIVSVLALFSSFLTHTIPTPLLGQSSVKSPQELRAVETYQSHRLRRLRLLRATQSRAG